jgi:AcrR family transcriptional regulator
MKTPRPKRAKQIRKTAEQRRKELLGIAVRVAQKVGYENITHIMLTRYARVTKTLWFHYFPTTRKLRNAVAKELGVMTRYKVSVAIKGNVELDYVVKATGKDDAKQTVVDSYRDGVPDLPVTGVRVSEVKGTRFKVEGLDKEEDDDA